jgi:hypothetical protein
MSLELVNTLATCATFVVIAATAIAAILQLRQLRASNQIIAFNELRQAYENPHLSAAHKYIDTQLGRDLEDPAFRHAVANRFARTEEMHGAWRRTLQTPLVVRLDFRIRRRHSQRYLVRSRRSQIPLDDRSVVAAREDALNRNAVHRLPYRRDLARADAIALDDRRHLIAVSPNELLVPGERRAASRQILV